MRENFRRLAAFFLLISFEVVIVWVIGIISFVLFFYLTHKIFVSEEEAMDMAVIRFVSELRSPALTQVMKVISFFASHEYLMVVPPLVVSVLLFFRNMHWYALLLLINSVSISLLNQGLKHLFARPRPITAMLHQSGNSFPSGHAMMGIVFYGLFIYIIWHMVAHKGWRWFFCTLVLLFILLIGFSRIYLQVHYFSDVVAGFAVGTFWLIVSVSVLNRMEPITSKQLRSRFHRPDDDTDQEI